MSDAGIALLCGAVAFQLVLGLWVLAPEGGESGGRSRKVSDPPRRDGVAQPGGFAAPDEGVGAVPSDASRGPDGGWWGR